jgi:hypothetical protein
MSAASSVSLRQRADYTHKHNLKTGRHGWLRLTPAYSVKIVEELIQDCERTMRIFDPFCGTATTALSAAYHGHEGVTTDINPFLVWLGQSKTACYSSKEISSTRLACTRVLALVKQNRAEISCAPPIHNIERWWSPAALAFLCAVKGAIETETENGSTERTLLLIAFCRTLIALSNAAFNHQSMSFTDVGQFNLNLNIDMPSLYAQDVDFVLAGAADNPAGSGKVILGDSRNPADCVEGPFDRVITSPPYANRMSYIRELRPYMYWLGFLVNARDAGELDWSAIGGTWGIATSRLTEWQSAPAGFKNKVLTSALGRIAHDDNKNGGLLSNYIAKYFDDMWVHFRGLKSVLAPGAEIHYIVGNSTFYGVLLPVEKLFAEMLRELSFTNIECRAIRKRNSKKELIEFDVTAVWPG